jgi:nucleotide-binding universal stress UspA family protein
MKKIIAPVDFSAVSKNAALYAANMAAYLDIPLVLLHVTELPLSYGEIPAVPVNEEQLLDDGDSLLKKLANEIDEELAGQVNIETISRTGNPLYEIAHYCNRIKAYALIIGTHGNSGFTRLLLGSTTLGVIRECNVPVIIVPNGYAFQKPYKFGLASDLNDVLHTIPAGLVIQFVNDFGSKLEILHVDKNGVEEEQELVAETNQINTIFAEQHPKVKILKSAFTEETLLNYSVEKGLDLLIIVPKKHSWIDLLINHQHTKNIALHAAIPVMVLKNDH